MAVDVVLRPEAGCIAVVHDEGRDLEPDEIVLDGDELLAVVRGRTVSLGILTVAMAEGARGCSVAVVVAMDGPSVAWSRRVDFKVSG